MLTFLRRLFYVLFTFFVLGIFSVLLIDFWFSVKTAKDIYTDIDDIPIRKVGLVLGTSKYYRNGSPNIYYKNRILGAKELFEHKKVSALLLSGDNRTVLYNEPATMRKDLIKEGIPSDFLYLDFAGFRTLDSIIRANIVFNSNNFTIITQKFHCERALFIAQFNNINAQCFAVESPVDSYHVRMREYLARVKAVLDLYVLKKTPHFLGNQIFIKEEIQ